MKIDLVVFDLDGTLVDSQETIYKTTLRALKEVNVNHELPRQEFNNMIGLHFEDIFEKFGFKVPDFEVFINIYKGLYFDFINESIMYQHVELVIDFLGEKGIKVSLLTTKAQDQAEEILKHFKLYPKFDFVMGRRPGIAHKPSPEPLQFICSQLKVDTGNTLIVGDSEMDVLCGKSAFARTCAVTYGYRTKEELELQEPDFIIDNLDDLKEIVDYSRT
jgi:phosphoglycolate phosphatase